MRFVVVILDGFGIGAMDDVKDIRPADLKANTLKSILTKYPDTKLPNLEFLGLMNAAGFETKNLKFSKNAIYGKMELMHHGADSFLGHQEIMGTIPEKPIDQCIQDSIHDIENALISLNYKVERIGIPPLQYLLVNDYVVISDNIDSDLGQAINCIAPLDYFDFEEQVKIGRIVRQHVKCNRVIVFGGTKNTIVDILNAEEVKNNKYIGNIAVKTKSYLNDYNVVHLGYGIDEKVQVPSILSSNQVPVTLIGKVADIVHNEKGINIPCVDTLTVMRHTINQLKSMTKGFICANVQETDLAGHSMDSEWYLKLLKIVDEQLGILIDKLDEDDVLCVIADHGNDPEIGHNYHTREVVPLLIKNKSVKISVNLGTRKTLADVGASVCEYFQVSSPANGISFIDDISKSNH